MATTVVKNKHQLTVLEHVTLNSARIVRRDLELTRSTPVSLGEAATELLNTRYMEGIKNSDRSALQVQASTVQNKLVKVLITVLQLIV
jgi:hypothetical protein